MTYENNILTASEGYVLRRIKDKMTFGRTKRIGYTYIMYGQPLSRGIKEYPEDYEEITQEQAKADELATKEREELNTEIDQELSRLLDEIEDYDENGINHFKIDDSFASLRLNQRTGLRNSIATEFRAGREKTVLFLANKSYVVTIESATELLDYLELYALNCYRATELNKMQVQEIAAKGTNEALLELKSYDIKSIYPDIISVTLTEDGRFEFSTVKY